MEERLYGYYPATYQTQAAQVRKTYNNECLYKFRDTMYDTKPAITPAPFLAVQGYSMAPPSSSRSSHSAAASHSSSSSKSMLRTKSAPVPRFKAIPRLNIPTPFQCWEDARTVSLTHLEGSRPPSAASTEVSWQLPKGIREPEVQAPAADRKSMSIAAPLQEHVDIDWHMPKPKSKVITPDVASITPETSRSRIQSASSHRAKVPVPSRAVKSAGVFRTPVRSTAEALQPEVHHIPASPPPATTRPHSPRPKNPVHEEEEEEEFPEALEWKEAREKYGWVAEVHGNPYGYKKLIKRLPYTVKIPVPELDPLPPAVHMVNVETYFQNTIPKKKHGAFTIHKDWISEGLHVKRMELQKKLGTNFRWRNFAFVY